MPGTVTVEIRRPSGGLLGRPPLHQQRRRLGHCTCRALRRATSPCVPGNRLRRGLALRTLYGRLRTQGEPVGLSLLRQLLDSKPRAHLRPGLRQVIPFALCEPPLRGRRSVQGNRLHRRRPSLAGPQVASVGAPSPCTQSDWPCHSPGRKASASRCASRFPQES